MQSPKWKRSAKWNTSTKTGPSLLCSQPPDLPHQAVNIDDGPWGLLPYTPYRPACSFPMLQRSCDILLSGLVSVQHSEIRIG